MSDAAVSRFLDLRALAALQHLRFSAKQRIEGVHSGRHISRRQGGAGEFADFREYSEGEDLRRLDWKVLARTGRAYTRLYQDETNLACMMVVDASASMEFGEGPSKLEYVQYLATALSETIHRQQDQVGLTVLADSLLELLPPAGTRSHVRRLQGILEFLRTELWAVPADAPGTDLAGGLNNLFLHTRRRGVLMLMSDFLVDDLEAVAGALRLFRHRRWEVIVLHIIHPDEETLPEGAAFRFEGLEGEGRIDCTPADIREQYQERFEAHAQAVRTLTLSAGGDYRRVSTAVPYMQTLRGFLVERNG
jgi:uncharacterized protein (DUF58 family)